MRFRDKVAIGRAAAIETDVSDAAAVQEMAQRAVQLYGKLDLAANVAGYRKIQRRCSRPPSSCGTSPTPSTIAASSSVSRRRSHTSWRLGVEPW